MLKIKLNHHLSIPIYYQIVEQIKRNIAMDIIKKGEKLPSVRELALHLKINPNTVAKAYKILIDENICESKPKKGIFVTKKGVDKSDIMMISNKLEKILIEAKSKNIEENNIIEIFYKILNKYYKINE